MRIAVTGLTIDVSIDGSRMNYKVLEQSDDFTEKLRALGNVTDEQTGLRMTSRGRPNYNTEQRKFYLRGTREDRHNDDVPANFDSPTAAIEAMMALDRMAHRAINEEAIVYRPEPGGTTAIRMALITKDQAHTLRLTANRHFPEERAWDVQDPITIDDNEHFGEHLSQVVDVLNKSKGNTPVAYDDGDNVNHHRVASEDARWAVNLLTNSFDEASEQGPGALVAFWRLVSGMRGPDVPNDQLDALNGR